MRLRYTRRAARNLDRISAYIAQENPPAAARVVARIEQVIEHLLHSPGAGSPTDRRGIRRVPVVTYPYLVFYEIRGDDVVIHHIRHGARRPWVGRR
jgi:addiction module RelE/StbE family toxin